MKLAELYEKPLLELTKSMELNDVKIHSDDKGTIMSIELKFKPEEKCKINDTNNPYF